MPVAVACSHCQTRLKLADTLIGKNLKCSKCGNVFQAAALEEFAEFIPEPNPEPAREEEVAAGPPPLSSPKRRPLLEEDEGEERRPRSGRRRRDEDEDEEEDDRPTRSRRKRKQKTNKKLILGLCFGGGVLALAGIILAVLLLVNGSTPEPVKPALAKGNVTPEPPPPKTTEKPPPASEKAPEPVKPVPAVPPAVVPDKPKEVAEAPKGLAPGAKITVRCEIQGSPPDFNGDYNKSVAQNLEIALRQLGYEPVAEGGLILQVRAQVGNSGNTIKVRPLGAPPPPRIRPKSGKSPLPRQNQEQVYPIEQITATFLLTDAQGAALWKNERKFTPHIRIFRTASPPREMQVQMWGMFDGWTRNGALQTLK